MWAFVFVSLVAAVSRFSPFRRLRPIADPRSEVIIANNDPLPAFVSDAITTQVDNLREDQRHLNEDMQKIDLPQPYILPPLKVASMQTASDENLDYGQNKAIQDGEASNQETTPSPEHTENERLRELDQLSRKQGRIISQLRRQLNDVNNQMSALRKDMEMRKKEDDLQRQGEANTVTIRIAKPPMNIAHVGKPAAPQFQNAEERLIEKKPIPVVFVQPEASTYMDKIVSDVANMQYMRFLFQLQNVLGQDPANAAESIKILMDDISGQIRYLEADAAAVEPSVSGTNE